MQGPVGWVERKRYPSAEFDRNHAASDLRLPRHALVRLRCDAPWHPVDPADRSRLLRWFGGGFPAVLARLQGAEPPGHWRLGVPLPPAEGKRRIALTVHPGTVADWCAPLGLDEVVPAAPSDWRDALALLAEYAAARGWAPRVYGSFAWQAITGVDYVTPSSDIDLAWQPAGSDDLPELFELLARWEHATGRRVDGEVLLPGGAGVCWRELAGGAAKVVVKNPATVVLHARADVIALLDVGNRQPSSYGNHAHLDTAR